MGICGIPVISVITEITELFDVGQVKSGGSLWLVDREVSACVTTVAKLHVKLAVIE
jgi:hypothetical protein